MSVASSSSTGSSWPCGVDRGAQRHAVHGVPGQLGGAEQPAVVLGRDADGVGGPPGGRGRLGAGERSSLRASAASAVLDARRATAARGAGRPCGARASAPTVGRVRGGVVDAEARPRRSRPARRRPRTAARAASGRRRVTHRRPSRRRPAGEAWPLGSEPDGEQAVGERDARGDAGDRLGASARRGRPGRAAWGPASGRPPSSAAWAMPAPTTSAATIATRAVSRRVESVRSRLMGRVPSGQLGDAELYARSLTVS